MELANREKTSQQRAASYSITISRKTSPNREANVIGFRSV